MAAPAPSECGPTRTSTRAEEEEAEEFAPSGILPLSPKGKGKGVAAESDEGEETEGPAAPGTPFRFFSPTSFWNTPLAADAPLDPISAGVTKQFLAEIAREKQVSKDPTINTRRWSVPVYTVPADQPTIRIEHNNGRTSPTLQAAWSAVPLPADAKAAAGTDEHLVVWQPSTDKLWEFWHLRRNGHGWRSPWGGAMEHVSTNPGVYGPEAWPGATTQWGGSACSLSLAGGLITLEDLERGRIDHALAIGIPDVRSGVYSLPAQRTDGKTPDPLALPEGARLRLDPELDLATLDLPPLALMIAEAAQRYGLIVRSLGSHVVFYGQDPTPTGSDPYMGKHGYFEGEEPSELLSSFPWDRLQLLKMQLSVAS